MVELFFCHRASYESDPKFMCFRKRYYDPRVRLSLWYGFWLRYAKSDSGASASPRIAKEGFIEE